MFSRVTITFMYNPAAFWTFSGVRREDLESVRGEFGAPVGTFVSMVGSLAAPGRPPAKFWSIIFAATEEDANRIGGKDVGGSVAGLLHCFEWFPASDRRAKGLRRKACIV